MHPPLKSMGPKLHHPAPNEVSAPLQKNLTAGKFLDVNRLHRKHCKKDCHVFLRFSKSATNHTGVILGLDAFIVLITIILFAFY